MGENSGTLQSMPDPTRRFWPRLGKLLAALVKPHNKPTLEPSAELGASNPVRSELTELEEMLQSKTADWRLAVPKVCQLLAEASIVDLSGEQHTLAYQFAAALFLEGLHSSLDRFEFEDKFDCWDCSMTGSIKGKVCRECKGKGYKYTYWAPGIRLRFTFGDAVYESLVREGLLKNYSQKHPLWDDMWSKGRRTTPTLWRTKNFKMVPMRRVSGPATKLSVNTDTAFALAQQIIKARKRENRRSAAAKTAEAKKARVTEGGVQGS
jgi:hypothetical protein